MRPPLRLRSGRLLAAAVLLPLALTACSDSGSTAGGTTSSSASSSAPSSSGAASSSTTVCDPVAGDTLVALDDDKQLQNSDNIIPVVRTAVLSDPLRQALDKVSAALSQEALAALNQATDVNRVSPADAAQSFVEDQALTEGLSGGSGPIKVVAANFAENQTLANVFADVLRGAGFDASVVQLTNREVYEAALEKGDVDVVAEYAATLTDFLSAKSGAAATDSPSSGDIDETVNALTELAQPLGLTPLTPAAATDQNAFAVTQAFADKYQVATLSDLASVCGGGVTLGGPPECPQRPFCQPGLESTYGLKVTGFTSLDAGGPLTKNAVKTGKVAVGLVFSSDASFSGS